jgi:hypothetical protein
MAVEEFGFDREDIQPSRFKKYKGKVGRVDRVGIVYAEGQSSCVGATCHFKDRYFLCKSTKDKKEICCLHSYEGNMSKTRVACILVVYDIGQKDGKNVLRGYELLPWIFSDTMYVKLKNLGKEWPFDKHDLTLTCTNDDFQTIEPNPCKESFWRSKPELQKKVIAEAAEMRKTLSRQLGADLSVTEIREQLGIDAPGSDDAAVDVNLGDVVGGL